MRNFFWSFVLLSVAAVGYCAWALMGAAQLASVAQGSDTGAIMNRVDLPVLRHSLAHQIVRAYLRQNEKLKKLSGLGQSLAGGVGASVADAMLEDILTPDNIAKILRDGRFGTQKLHIGTAVQLPQLSGIESQGIGTVLNAYFDSFTSLAVPIAHNGESYAVHLLLDGTTWKLSGLDLPASLVDRLAREVTERQKQSRPPAPAGAHAMFTDHPRSVERVT